MVTINLKGREIPLLYTTLEMKMIQEEIGPMNKAVNLIMGRNPEDDDDTSLFGGAEHLNALGKTVRMMGNAALEENGETPDLTDKWVLRAMKPKQIMETVQAVLNAMAEGMGSEIPETKDEGPVDVTLEEMNKKKAKDD